MIIPNTSGIYIRKNPSGNIYIGQAIDLRKRKERLPKPQQKILYASYKKYGKNNHTFDILELCDTTELSNKEIYYIDLYKSNKCKYPNGNGMNMTDGGESFMKGRKTSDETKAKIRAVKMGNTNRLGHKASSETLIKLIKAKMGKKLSAETKLKISAKLTGRSFSNDHLANLKTSANNRKCPSV